MNIDFSQNLGVLPRWQRYTTALRKTRGPLDAQLLKELDMKLERTYYVLRAVAPSETVRQWDVAMGYEGAGYGSDIILDNIISHGAQPLIDLVGIPNWISDQGYDGIYWRGDHSPPSNETKWEALIVEVLTHIKTKYPEIVYVNFLNESLDDWEAWYNIWYGHTSHAVDIVNANLPVGVPKIKFGGKDDYSYKNGYFPSYDGGYDRWGSPVKSFLGYAKDNNLNLDVLTWHIYNNQCEYFGLPIDDINSSVTSIINMKQWLDNRNMNAELIITEWCNRGDNLKLNLEPIEQCFESTWTIAGWSTMMELGIDVIPIHFGNMNYGQPDQSLLTPDLCYYTDTDIADGTIHPTNFPPGSFLAKYNIYKMLKMSKGTLVSAKNENNAYIIASKDDTGIAVIIANHQNISQSVTINLSNLPGNFQMDNNHYEQYLVDTTHSVFNRYNPSKNNQLEKVDDIILSPISNFSKTYNMFNYSTIFIIITPEAAPCYPQFEFQITQ